MSELLDLASAVEKQSRELGADEVVAVVSRGVHTNLTRRDGKVEQATESVTRGLSVSFLVDGKFSSHSTSDLRPDALKEFLARGVAATRYLEEDRDHRLPDAAVSGRGASDEALDQYDASYERLTAEDRATSSEALERAVDAVGIPNRISAAVHLGDGMSETARVASNGFSDVHREAWFMLGAEATTHDGDKRPEASTHYAVRYRGDLPPVETIAADLQAKIAERVGSRAIASGTYPLVLANRSAGRILGVLGGPMSGSALHQGRSCLTNKKGEKIGSDLLTLIDDPLLPRGLASRPWDGDGLRAEKRTFLEKGVLKDYYVSVYYGRKLGMAPTTGGRSNWIVPAGDRSWQEIARQYPKAILVDGFLGGNSNAVTGDFSFGIRGVLLENGEKTRSLSEMNVSGNVLDVFHKLVAVANDPWRYTSVIVPTLVFEGIQFSGT